MRVAYVIWLESLKSPILKEQVIEILKEINELSFKKNIYFFAFQPVYHVLLHYKEFQHIKKGLRHLNKWNESRRGNAKKYNELLSNIDGIITPYEADYVKHVYHLYVIRVKKIRRDKLREELKFKGVATGIHYPTPLHLHPAYSYLGCKKGAFPVTEKASKEVLSSPIYPEINEKHIKEVAELFVNCKK